VAGVTAAQATATIDNALTAYLASRSPAAPLTAASLLDAIRNEAQFAAVRPETLVTVEDAQGLFQQLTDGAGSYTPQANETLQKAALNISVKEGAV
jgi:hypothetical protein